MLLAQVQKIRENKGKFFVELADFILKASLSIIVLNSKTLFKTAVFYTLFRSRLKLSGYEIIIHELILEYFISCREWIFV